MSKRKMENNLLNINSYRRHYGKGHSNRISRQKWKKQRINRGFADCDCWNMEWYLLELLPAMLDNLAITAAGYPIGYPDWESWKKELKAKADKFRKVATLVSEGEDHVGVWSNEEWEKYHKKLDRAINDAFKSLGKDFLALWD